jgi:hypothetical protein
MRQYASRRVLRRCQQSNDHLLQRNDVRLQLGPCSSCCVTHVSREV